VFWLWPLPLALPVYALSVLISAATYNYAAIAMRRAITSGRESLLHARGTVLSKAGDKISVRVQGELCSARAHEDLEPGDLVEVLDVVGLTLEVRRWPGAPPAAAVLNRPGAAL
jgi:membrane protein implicated in regulation of membrane protease activity